MGANNDVIGSRSPGQGLGHQGIQEIRLDRGVSTESNAPGRALHGVGQRSLRERSAMHIDSTPAMNEDQGLVAQHVVLEDRDVGRLLQSGRTGGSRRCADEQLGVAAPLRSGSEAGTFVQAVQVHCEAHGQIVIRLS